MTNGVSEHQHNRLNWIDYTRGFALIFVIFAHSQIPSHLFEFVSYIIAVFPFISGYLYKAKSINDVVKKRFPFILSYYYIGAINYLIWIAFVPDTFRRADNFTYLKNYLLVRTDLFEKIPLVVVPLWYLVFLFFAEVLYHFTLKTRTLQIFIIVGVLSRFFHSGSLPFKLDVVLASLYMFEIGRVFKEKKIQVVNLIGLLSLVTWVVITTLNGSTSWNTDEYGRNPLLSMIGEISCVVFVVWINQSIEKRKVTNKILGKILKFFSDNALFVLGYHMLLGSLVILLLMLLKFSVTEENLRNYWYITFAIMLVTTYLITLTLPASVKEILTKPDRLLGINKILKKESKNKDD
ncbi:MAG: acyltransferase family protein [Fervidobacterium sp.]